MGQGMTDTILRSDAREPSVRPESGSGATVDVGAAIVPPLTAFGLILVAVGMIDLGLAWWPPMFGRGEWEFGTASRTFNSLALGATGYVFLVMAASLRRWALGLRSLSVVSAIGFLALAGVLLLYWKNVPVALAAVPEQSRPALEQAILRSTSFAVLYILLFGWLSWFTWRRGGAGRGAP